MKMMQGAFFLPCSKRSRTRLAPTPTNISTKSEPEIEKNGTLASPAIARASSVLPVPGGRQAKRPSDSPAQLLELLRIFQELNNFLQLFLGLVRTGDVLERGFLLLRGEQPRADLPKLRALFPPDCICRIRNKQKPTRRIRGAAFSRINTQSPLRTSFTFSCTPCPSRLS